NASPRSRTDRTISTGDNQPATPAAVPPAIPSRASTPAVVQVGAAPTTASSALARPLQIPFILSLVARAAGRLLLHYLAILHEDGPWLFRQVLQERREVPLPSLQPAGDARRLLAALDRLAQPGELRLVAGLGLRVLLQHEIIVGARHLQDGAVFLHDHLADGCHVDPVQRHAGVA